jgi:hypothetical protein
VLGSFLNIAGLQLSHLGEATLKEW